MMTEQESRARLERERARLEEELAALAVQERSAEGLEGGGYGTHLADDATETFDHEQAVALARHMRGMLEQVERALHKLDDGSYGRCDGCGGPIDPERLEALPHATLCLACQSRREARR